MLHHAVKRNPLRAFGEDENLPGVFIRQKALGRDHEQVNRGNQHGR